MKTRISAALACVGLLMTMPVQAQDSSMTDEELSTEDVITAAIGCIAAYDTILAQGRGGAMTGDIEAARAFAVAVYKEYSEESDEQVAEDIRIADEVFPQMLAEGTVTLDEYQETCDAVFMEAEVEAAPSV